MAQVMAVVIMMVTMIAMMVMVVMPLEPLLVMSAGRRKGLPDYLDEPW